LFFTNDGSKGEKFDNSNIDQNNILQRPRHQKRQPTVQRPRQPTQQRPRHDQDNKKAIETTKTTKKLNQGGGENNSDGDDDTKRRHGGGQH